MATKNVLKGINVLVTMDLVKYSIKSSESQPCYMRWHFYVRWYWSVLLSLWATRKFFPLEYRLNSLKFILAYALAYVHFFMRNFEFRPESYLVLCKIEENIEYKSETNKKITILFAVLSIECWFIQLVVGLMSYWLWCYVNFEQCRTRQIRQYMYVFLCR